MSSSMGRMTSHTLWKIIQMFETTNQYIYVIFSKPDPRISWLAIKISARGCPETRLLSRSIRPGRVNQGDMTWNIWNPSKFYDFEWFLQENVTRKMDFIHLVPAGRCLASSACFFSGCAARHAWINGLQKHNGFRGWNLKLAIRFLKWTLWPRRIFCFPGTYCHLNHFRCWDAHNCEISKARWIFSHDLTTQEGATSQGRKRLRVVLLPWHMKTLGWRFPGLEVGFRQLIWGTRR